MKRRFYREIWSHRFHKMLELEKRSVRDYQSLLEDCKKKHGSGVILTHFEKLINDEQKHVLLVEELLNILHRQID